MPFNHLYTVYYLCQFVFQILFRGTIPFGMRFDSFALGLFDYQKPS